MFCFFPRFSQAVDELLAAGADPNLPLTRRVGSVLCTLANISYDRGPEPRNQINLVILFNFLSFGFHSKLVNEIRHNTMLFPSFFILPH